MATELELNHLDHNKYSAIKQNTQQRNRADVSGIHTEVIKIFDFESIRKKLLNDRIEMLLQNYKMIKRLDQKNHIAERKVY